MIPDDSIPFWFMVIPTVGAIVGYLALTFIYIRWLRRWNKRWFK